MTKEIYKEKTVTDQQINTTKLHNLILINDDYHTFDFVIETLIDVCNHTIEQAAQCAMITHYKGECDVKKGNIKELRILRKALIDRELRAKID